MDAVAPSRAARLSPVDLACGRHGRQRVARLREVELELDARHRRLAVDAREEALARELALARVGLLQVEEDVVRTVLRRRDAVDDDPIEGQHVVVQDAQEAAAARVDGARVEAEDRVQRIDGRLEQRRARVYVAQLEAPGAGEVEDGVEVAELSAHDLEEAPRWLRLSRGEGRGRVLGRERREEADALAALEGRESPQRPGDAQIVDREAAADERPQLDARVEVRDVEHDGALRIDDLEAVDGDGAGDVRHEVDERAQMPGDAADGQLARVGRQRALDELAEARALQDHGRREHGERHETDQPQQGESEHFGEAGLRHERRPFWHKAPQRRRLPRASPRARRRRRARVIGVPRSSPCPTPRPLPRPAAASPACTSSTP
jgi:hypothetical protein